MRNFRKTKLKDWSIIRDLVQDFGFKKPTSDIVGEVNCMVHSHISEFSGTQNSKNMGLPEFRQL